MERERQRLVFLARLVIERAKRRLLLSLALAFCAHPLSRESECSSSCYVQQTWQRPLRRGDREERGDECGGGRNVCVFFPLQTKFCDGERSKRCFPSIFSLFRSSTPSFLRTNERRSAFFLPFSSSRGSRQALSPYQLSSAAPPDRHESRQRAKSLCSHLSLSLSLSLPLLHSSFCSAIKLLNDRLLQTLLLTAGSSLFFHRL